MRISASIFAILIALALIAQTAPPAAPPTTLASSPTKPAEQPNDDDAGMLKPIPDQGGLPAMYSQLYRRQHAELTHRSAVRGYTRQLRQIRYKHFGQMKVKSIREEGIAQLAEFTDPAAFHPMIKELSLEQDDVRLAVLDHFAKQGDEGQAALAWVVIYDKDAAICNEALSRMTTPVGQPVMFVLDAALRSSNERIASSAAVVAGSLNILQAIPLLIFAQATGSQAGNDRQGDLAWIAIQTQQAYVAGLQPVVGGGSGAFRPIIGVVSSGSVLRVQDAVVIEYRTIVHNALVNMTTNDWGQSTESMGYNIKAWWEWYNEVYLPFKKAQVNGSNNEVGTDSGGE